MTKEECYRKFPWAVVQDFLYERYGGTDYMADRTAAELRERLAGYGHTFAAGDNEIERLQELLRGAGANRYWEGRWRDQCAEIERLRAALLKTS